MAGIRFLFIDLKRYWTLFVFIFLLLGFQDFTFDLQEDFTERAWSLFFYDIGLSYIYCLIYQHISKWKYIKVAYLAVTLLYMAIFFVLDFYCTRYLEVHFFLIVGILLGSNLNESYEFFSTAISWNMILQFIISLVILAIPFIIKAVTDRRVNGINDKFYKYLYYIFNIFFIGSFIFLLFNTEDETHILGKTGIMLNYEIPPDLRDTQTFPEIEKLSAEIPDNIVMIFGESLSKDHMSLYQYSKDTNPVLTEMANDSLLYVFRNVKACGCHTIASFKGFMSTYSYSRPSSKKWYNEINLIETLRQTGYSTTWISNQSRMGFFDNEITKYAELCDQNIYTSNLPKVKYNNDIAYDGTLIPICKKYRDNKKAVFFVHLMGSHPAFSCRYPKEFDRFKPGEYTHLAEHKREQISDYDNSVLYNDYVVSEIINLYKNKDAIVIYFSDHALDLYQSSDDYIGHAKHNRKSSEYGKRIPFIVYTTPVFKAKHPDKIKKIEANLQTDFDTENFIYSVMDLIDVKFKDNDDVAKYSLFNQHKPTQAIK